MKYYLILLISIIFSICSVLVIIPWFRNFKKKFLHKLMEDMLTYTQEEHEFIFGEDEDMSDMKEDRPKRKIPEDGILKEIEFFESEDRVFRDKL